VLATKNHLLFPPEVLSELERGSVGNPDPPLEWAKTHRSSAERKAPLDGVRQVLSVAADVLDPDSPHEQADPYVLALALELRRGFEVTIVTDDRKDKPTKLSLATAAGMLGIPTVPLFAFVRQEGLEPA
jgi:hypothetical protein